MVSTRKVADTWQDERYEGRSGEMIELNMTSPLVGWQLLIVSWFQESSIFDSVSGSTFGWAVPVAASWNSRVARAGPVEGRCRWGAEGNLLRPEAQ